ncbi:MAG TPA: hypothetical protein VGL93_23090 [Streptosporangiaceae bacterium]
MEAEPTPTRDTPANARLAAAPGRLRGLVTGALRRPIARRALVVGGLAVAGWLLGAGNGAWAADVPQAGPSAAHAADGPTTSDPVRGQVDQAGGLVHTGSDAVGRTADSLDRSHLAARSGTTPTTSDPVRGQVRQAGGLVHTGSDAVGRTADSLDHVRLAKHSERVGGLVRDGSAAVGHTAGSAADSVRHGSLPDNPVTSTLARRSAGLVGDPGAAPRRADVGRIAAPVASLLGSGTDKVRQALPVHGALGDPSSVVAPLTHGVRHTAARPRTAVPATAILPAPTNGAAFGTRTPASSGDARQGAPGTRTAPVLTRPIEPRVLCAHSAFACGHTDSHGHPDAPEAPAGPQADNHGVVPSPVTSTGQPAPSTGDVTWTHVDRTPPHLAIVAPRRGVLPPVVRTAADEPSLSPD